jgi:nucleoid-associated protein YgaU
MGLRYGLLAALTLVLASALLWDRLHPPAGNSLFPREEPAREDRAVLVVGGTPRPEPLPAPGRAGGTPDGKAAAPDAPTGPEEVTVEKGDTLSAIASRTMGSSRGAADLARFNGIRVGATLRVGQVLRVPPAAPASPGAAAGPPPDAPPSDSAPAPAAPRPSAGKTHTVGSGDTLFGLARRYYGDGTKFRRIAEANGLDTDEPLRVGRDLKIP